MRITQLINEYLVNPHTIDVRGRFSHYPSEASVISRLDSSIIGKCHRASWFSWKGIEASNPLNPRAYWTFETAKSIEKSYVEFCKQLGIWAGNNIKFYDSKHNVSGEADIFVFDQPSTTHKDMRGVEIKTAYVSNSTWLETFSTPTLYFLDGTLIPDQDLDVGEEGYFVLSPYHGVLYIKQGIHRKMWNIYLISAVSQMGRY